MIITHSVLLRMRNASEERCRENQNTHFIYNKLFFSENRAFREIMWKNMEESDRSQMTVRRTRILCWIPKATNTHSDSVIFIAFPLQQWLHERALLLRYTYIACLVTVWNAIVSQYPYHSYCAQWRFGCLEGATTMPPPPVIEFVNC